MLRARPDWSGKRPGSTCRGQGLHVGCACRCLLPPSWTLGLAQRAVLAHCALLGTGWLSAGAQDDLREVMRSAHAQVQGSDAGVGALTGRVQPASPSAACACADYGGVRSWARCLSASSQPGEMPVKKPHNEAATQLLGSACERTLGLLTWFWSKWTR